MTATPPPRPIAVTCGEPAGIGPEIAVAAWRALKGEVPMLWIGDPGHLPEGTPIHLITRPDDGAAISEVSHAALPVLAHDFDGPATPGRPDPVHAQGVIDVIARAVDLTQTGAAGAICTAPIHKAALIEGAGFAYPGHTEYLAVLAGLPPEAAVMMLACEALRVVPATIHIPLSQVARTLTADHLRATIEVTHAALRRDFAINAPRIALAGLNPHAGEEGKIGLEEREVIAPLVQTLQKEGMDIIGPLSADTMFHPAARARYDAAICMYHDQALIPIKTIDFSGGVNVTLGLPFVRTSPDHGTAFDIAGQGKADATSMIAALRMASAMAKARAT